MRMKPHEFETGKTYGCLTVLERDGQLNNRPAYRAQCQCGLIIRVKSFHLAQNRKWCSLQCGLKLTNYRHGAAVTTDFPGAYRTWLAMRQRCLDPASKSYKNYGGRGITIDERWNDFYNFLKDM